MVDQLAPEAMRILELVLARGDVTSEQLRDAFPTAPGELNLHVESLVTVGLIRLHSASSGEIHLTIAATATLKHLLDGHGPHVSRAALRLLRARRALDNMLTARQPDGDGIERVADSGQIVEKLAECAKSAHSEVLSLHAGNPPSKETLQQSMPSDIAIMQRGVRVRIVSPRSFLDQSHIPSYVEQMRENGAQMRFADGVPHRMVVFDRISAVVPVNPHRLGQGALFITAPTLVRDLHHLGQVIYSRARELSGAQLRSPEAGPSERERQVLLLMSLGATDKTAAARLGISDRQFRRDVAKLCDELGASSRFQAGVIAVARGWL